MVNIVHKRSFNWREKCVFVDQLRTAGPICVSHFFSVVRNRQKKFFFCKTGKVGKLENTKIDILY